VTAHELPGRSTRPVARCRPPSAPPRSRRSRHVLEAGAPPVLPVVALREGGDPRPLPGDEQPVPDGPPNFAADADSRSAPSCRASARAGRRSGRRRRAAAPRWRGRPARPRAPAGSCPPRGWRAAGAPPACRRRRARRRRRDRRARRRRPDDVEAVAPFVAQPLAGAQHARVLDGARDEVAPVVAPSLRRSRGAEDGQVDRLGAPRGPGDRPLARAEQPGDGRRRAVEQVATEPALRVPAGGVPGVGRVDVEPGLPGLGPERPEGGVIEVGPRCHGVTVGGGPGRGDARAGRVRLPRSVPGVTGAA
jgi:hypothetical protein